MKNEVVAISGQLLRNLSNSQVTELVKNNFVLLDGECVQVLLDRNLGNLLHIEKAEWHPVRSNYQVFEQADGQIVEGVKSPRITMLQQTGNYLKIVYQPQNSVKVWSFAYNAIDEKLGNVMAVIDQHIVVLPIDQDSRYGWESQFTTYKQGLLQQILDSVKPVDYLVGMPNVKLLVENDGQKAWLANFTLDSYQQIKWHLAAPLTSNEATIIRKDNNSVRKSKAQISVENGIAIINEALAPLETIQILF